MFYLFFKNINNIIFINFKIIIELKEIRKFYIVHGKLVSFESYCF